MMYVVIFILSFCINFLYAMYVKSISKDQMWMAAIYGEVYVLINAVIVINYVSDPYFLIPLISGGFLGTILTKKICSLLNIKI